MEKVNITTDLCNVIVFAKAKVIGYENWLVFISNVEDEFDYVHNVYKPHIRCFICFKSNIYLANSFEEYFSEHGEQPWGYTTCYDFYWPTKAQKMRVIKALRRRGYKYVSSLKKLVKKC